MNILPSPSGGVWEYGVGVWCGSVGVWECGLGVLECGCESVEVWEWWGRWWGQGEYYVTLSRACYLHPCNHENINALKLCYYMFINILGHWNDIV